MHMHYPVYFYNLFNFTIEIVSIHTFNMCKFLFIAKLFK